MNYLYYSRTSNIEKVEIFYVLHDKVALLMKRRYKRGTRNCHHKFLKRFGP